jgi:formate dehydrogenase subunit gamma
VIILEIERFTSNQIIVHFIAALSLLVLYITGIPQLYPEHLGWILDLVGLSKAMFIHRLAGFGLVSVAVYYLIYSIFSVIINGREYYSKILFPTSADIIDYVNDNLSILGMQQQRIDYDKYSWLEKGLIWSVIIVDCIIMGITGIILFAPWSFASILPLSYLMTIRLVHASFAILSLCVILPHFYLVHLSQFKFPMSKSMFTGTISEEEAREEYPKWYREVTGETHD